MKRTFSNIMIGSIVCMAGVAVFSLIKKNTVKREIKLEQEEIKREYIDLSNQLKQAQEKQDELEKEVEELKDDKVYVKEYNA